MSPSPSIQETNKRFRHGQNREATARNAAEASRCLDEPTCAIAFGVATGSVVVVDCTGRIIAANAAWSRFKRQNGQQFKELVPGDNYLKACQTAMELGYGNASAALGGIMSVLDGSIAEFRFMYRWPNESGDRSFEMSVRPLRQCEGGAVITNRDLTPQPFVAKRLRSIRRPVSNIRKIIAQNM